MQEQAGRHSSLGMTECWLRELSDDTQRVTCWVGMWLVWRPVSESQRLSLRASEPHRTRNLFLQRLPLCVRLHPPVGLHNTRKTAGEAELMRAADWASGTGPFRGAGTLLRADATRHTTPRQCAIALSQHGADTGRLCGELWPDGDRCRAVWSTLRPGIMQWRSAKMCSRDEPRCCCACRGWIKVHFQRNMCQPTQPPTDPD